MHWSYSSIVSSIYQLSWCILPQKNTCLCTGWFTGLSMNTRYGETLSNHYWSSWVFRMQLTSITLPPWKVLYILSCIWLPGRQCCFIKGLVHLRTWVSVSGAWISNYNLQYSVGWNFTYRCPRYLFLSCQSPHATWVIKLKSVLVQVMVCYLRQQIINRCNAG